MVNCNNENELYHYGVMGMKWGVRRNPQKAYTKAITKKEKLLAKSEKASQKSSKYLKKGSKGYLTEIGRATREKQILNSQKNKGKALRYQEKAEKWQRKIDETFGSQAVNRLSSDAISRGKQALSRYT